MIRFLAFESSCDDTSVALLEAEVGSDLPRLVSMSVQSQWEVHERFGGIVPELASRAHLANILPCLEKVFAESGGIKLEDIDFFSATHQPGLIGCLLIGHTAAKTLSLLYDKPLISCHHIEGHLMSIFLEHRPKFPFLALVVSGGHTSLYKISSLDEYEQLGVTLDDAAGEAFDKGAKLIGLPQPGGPQIDRLAKSGDSHRFKFGKVQTRDLQFSFSGLKSEFSRLVQREGISSAADLAASYQKALVDHLMQKMELALEQTRARELVIVGGVARNSELRARLEIMQKAGKLDHYYAPSPQFCTDNAAMIGVVAYRKFVNGEFSDLRSDVISTSRPARQKKNLTLPLQKVS